MAISINQPAPDFTLLTDKGSSFSLSDMQGKKVILYFYPKDDTPGCTAEACGFRDIWSELKKLNVEVIGISKDTVKAHQKFKEKYALPFTLLADPEKRVCELYGVMVEKSRYGRKYLGIERTTLLIDEKGHIAAVWPNVKVAGHFDAVLEEIQK